MRGYHSKISAAIYFLIQTTESKVAVPGLGQLLQTMCDEVCLDDWIRDIYLPGQHANMVAIGTSMITGLKKAE